MPTSDPKPIIPKSELRHGVYYYGKCRNATVARWNETEKCFYHWRVKFGLVFMETIKHREDDDIFDVFDAFGELTVPEQEIPFLIEDR